MAKRDNHYEAAFEHFLRACQIPYVAVDETRRSLCGGDESLKSLDFIVSTPTGASWLVDVKGRRFPSAEQQYWKNWSTRDDLQSLARWERLFGERFGGLFMFAYNVVGDRAPLDEDQLVEFRGALYAFVAVRLTDYAQHAHPISPSWDTWAMPTAQFRQLAVPAQELFGVCCNAHHDPSVTSLISGL